LIRFGKKTDAKKRQGTMHLIRPECSQSADAMRSESMRSNAVKRGQMRSNALHDRIVRNRPERIAVGDGLDGVSVGLWIGLDWIGLDWIGLDWIGLDWIGGWGVVWMGCFERVWVL